MDEMGLCWFAVFTLVLCTTLGEKQDEILISKIGKLHFQLFKSIQRKANLVKSATFETRCSNNGCSFDDCRGGKQKDEHKCRDGWKKFNEHCYKLITTKLNFFEAEMFCRTQQSSLVNIENTNEDAWIKGFKEKHVWISGTDLAKHGEWKWFSSGRTMKFTNWARGQPQKNHEHCAVYYIGGWHDASCSIKSSFICKY
ncbi:collectin-12-like [Ostrea edulis]|uniref:collectin-12-like n=1 Tax=Ostrea edulis TaxID=37623 RepID=UPI002094AED8|nr:collectin-12-like [Ostrea edulis]